jgi:hypothetical protein
MAISTTPVPRLQMLVFAYELIENDLLVNDDDGTTRRVASITGTTTVTVTFDDDSTQAMPRRTMLTVYRDQSKLPESYAHLTPFIVA